MKKLKAEGILDNCLIVYAKPYFAGSRVKVNS